VTAPSAVVLVPLLVTVLVVAVIVVTTARTVRAERRFNAVLAIRWAATQRTRRLLAAHRTAGIRSARALAKRDAA
jgi:hypothetical protein